MVERCNHEFSSLLYPSCWATANREDIQAFLSPLFLVASSRPCSFIFLHLIGVHTSIFWRVHRISLPSSMYVHIYPHPQCTKQTRVMFHWVAARSPASIRPTAETGINAAYTSDVAWAAWTTRQLKGALNSFPLQSHAVTQFMILFQSTYTYHAGSRCLYPLMHSCMHCQRSGEGSAEIAYLPRKLLA